MSRQSDAKAKMIRTAAALFRQRGYNGVGLTELLEASEAPKGSFYYHFPGGKEQLAEAAVRHAGAGVSRLIDDAFASAPDLQTGVRSLITMIAGWHQQTGFREGCPITSVVLDLVPQSEAISTAVREVFDEWGQRFRHHAHRLGHTDLRPGDGLHLLMLIEGAWILSRAYQSRKPMLDAAELYLAGLGLSTQPHSRSAKLKP
jgi:TetR/AcrR family transcriptional regulator, lmrAB and yxaGH operons repressor